MKKFFTLLFLLSYLSHAQNVTHSHLHLEGKISTYPITMYLDIDNDSVEGKYFYNKIRQVLLLKGQLENNKIKLTEQTQDSTATGNFSGKIINNKFTGTWQTPSGNKTLKFILTAKNSFQKKDSAGYTVYYYNKYLPLYSDTDIVGISLFYHILLPKVNKTLRKVIMDTIFGFPNLTNDEKVQKDIDLNIFDYYETMGTFDKNEILDDTYMASYSYETDVNKFYENNRFIIMESDNSSYTGGAHGIYYSISYVFDKQHNKQITLNDIFYEKDSTSIKELIIKKLKKSGYYDNVYTEMFISNVFYFDNKYFYFFYNVYDIAPYAAGPVEIKIPYKEIKRYFKPSFAKVMKIK